MMGDFNDNVFPKGTPLPDGSKARPTDPVVPRSTRPTVSPSSPTTPVSVEKVPAGNGYNADFN